MAPGNRQRNSQEIVATAGIDPERKTIAYCNGGVTATAVLFALHRLSNDNFANYDGSWNEWGERLGSAGGVRLRLRRRCQGADSNRRPHDFQS